MINLQCLKNTVKVAKHTNKPENFSAKISNEHKDISITVTYYPEKNIKEDIYPYWLIEMREEEFSQKLMRGANDLHEIRDIYNKFTSQGIGESYLENNIIPY